MTMAESLKEEGFKLGFKLGIQKSKVNITLNCLKEGASVECIAKISGFSEAEITEIAFRINQ